MVYAFFIQTIHPKDCSIIYYRFYNCYAIKDDSQKGSKIFESPQEQKNLLKNISKQVQMQSEMKRSHALVPPGSETAFKGIFALRFPGLPSEMLVAWHGTASLGFGLLLNRLDNQLQAHSALSTLFDQLERHLLLVSNPTLSLRIIETISLVVDACLPAGQILFRNSIRLKQLEDTISKELYSK